MVLNTTPAVRATVSSITFQARDLSVLGICGYLSLCRSKSCRRSKYQSRINSGPAVPKPTYTYLDAFAGSPVYNPVCEALPSTDDVPGRPLSPNSSIVSVTWDVRSTGMCPSARFGG